MFFNVKIVKKNNVFLGVHNKYRKKMSCNNYDLIKFYKIDLTRLN